MRSGGGLSRRRTKKTRIGWMLHARLRKWSKSLGEEAVQKDPVTRQHDVKPDTDRDRWSYIPRKRWCRKLDRDEQAAYEADECWGLYRPKHA